MVWDPVTFTLHVESDELLDQHTRYGLIVTRAVKDINRDPVEATTDFRYFLAVSLWDQWWRGGDYGTTLLDAMGGARRAGVGGREVVSASVFTTQSVTAILEKIRGQIKAATPASADFKLGPGGTRTVFALNDVVSVVNNQQTGDNPPRFTPVSLGPPRDSAGIGQVAFGKYLSPDYEVHPGEYIPPVGTLSGVPEVRATNEIYFNLFLPTRPKPPGGWPVAIFGHGANGSKNLSLFVAGSVAGQGIAMIAVNAVGHDFGPQGTMTVTLSNGNSGTFPSGGRGRDQNGDGAIGTNEGVGAARPRNVINTRDGLRQTVVDMIQLVRVIESGIDIDGDGSRDLDPSRIYYVGSSMGGFDGTILTPLEPSVRAAVLTVAGGPSVHIGRLSSVNRPGIGTGLASRVPSLLNAPGITELNGVPVSGPFFNENIPLRNQPPVINTVAGAMEIQALFENREWVQQSGDPVAYARYIRRDPLPGMAAKPVIFQFAKGDQTVPNPGTTALLRAGDLTDRATYYRHDLAFATNPTLPTNPHSFMLTFATPSTADIARTAQRQIAIFFASDGLEVIDPDGPEQPDGTGRLFEVPIVPPLPEELNFIP